MEQSFNSLLELLTFQSQDLHKHDKKSTLAPSDFNHSKSNWTSLKTLSTTYVLIIFIPSHQNYTLHLQVFSLSFKNFIFSKITGFWDLWHCNFNDTFGKMPTMAIFCDRVAWRCSTRFKTLVWGSKPVISPTTT